MRIETLRLYEVELPIVGPGYQLSRGRLVTSTTCLVVEITTDTGLVGFGESCPFGSSYLPAFAAGARSALIELAPLLIHRDPLAIDEVNRAMDRALSGHIYAKSGIDIACWDLFGKATGLPLYALLGGMATAFPPVRSSVNAAEGPNLAALVQAKRDKGFSVLTLKVGDDVARDAELTVRVAAEREAGELLTVDANGGWRLDQAMEYAHRIADVPGVMIEQPCQTLEDCLALAARTPHTVVLDESLDSIDVLADVLSRRLVSAFNLKIERIGGITKTRQLRDLALAMGATMFMQEVGGSEITYAATTHLAHTVPEANLLGATTMKVTRSLADGAPEIVDGRVSCSDRPGLGLSINRAALGAPIGELRSQRTPRPIEGPQT